ncbi:quinone reductase [Leptodontidium sp. MPI-SDFR-AT-0119]|nr:quinone reductase [Leptodontidium sp. MPI-SDFR-AT-0119]
MPTNHAAYLVGAKSHPLEVKEAPYPSVEANTVIVRNYAVAINPIDWKLQTYAFLPLNYPTILGSDAAGVVVQVGSGVTNVVEGQRVIGYCVGTGIGDSRYAGFQEYSVMPANAVAPIPDSISYEQGAVLPLAICTAAAGLYQKDHLSLPYPADSIKHNEGTILIWGGSSSVGTASVQLSRASGFEVISTASVHNHDLVKSLGASEVFDHASKSVVSEVVAALKGKQVVGVFDCISEEETQKKCAEILVKCDAAKKLLSLVLPAVDGLPSEVTVNSLFATTILSNGVATAIWQDYLPKALKTGEFKPAPQALVVGTGLEFIQEAIEKNKAGLSASKAVVKLS